MSCNIWTAQEELAKSGYQRQSYTVLFILLPWYEKRTGQWKSNQEAGYKNP